MQVNIVILAFQVIKLFLGPPGSKVSTQVTGPLRFTKLTLLNHDHLEDIQVILVIYVMRIRYHSGRRCYQGHTCHSGKATHPGNSGYEGQSGHPGYSANRGSRWQPWLASPRSSWSPSTRSTQAHIGLSNFTLVHPSVPRSPMI